MKDKSININIRNTNTNILKKIKKNVKEDQEMEKIKRNYQ